MGVSVFSWTIDVATQTKFPYCHWYRRSQNQKHRSYKSIFFFSSFFFLFLCIICGSPSSCTDISLKWQEKTALISSTCIGWIACSASGSKNQKVLGRPEQHSGGIVGKWMWCRFDIIFVTWQMASFIVVTMVAISDTGLDQWQSTLGALHVYRHVYMKFGLSLDSLY